MSTVVTDVSVIERIVGEAVQRAVSEQLPALVQRAAVKPFLNQSEVRDLTGFSNRKLAYLRKTKQVEYTPLGRSYLYSTKSLLDFLEEKRVRLRSELPSWSAEGSQGLREG